MKISNNDKNRYHSSILENGLRLLYVENENAAKSACSLVVNTGSFDDPNDRPGFAHFIEHLLFNGNKKFPEPNAINDFVAKHGGHCNAWTATEHSNFFFDINHNSLPNALDFFAHLFIDPLFDDAAITREQEAIHAEFKLKLRDDTRRIQQVHKETCNPEHPYSKFSVGNRQTLSDLPERPVRDELQSFWDANYQAQYMTVCIVSNDDSNLELAKQVFSRIPSANPNQNKPAITPSLYRKEDLGTFICIRPVKELHKLNITFALPSVNQLYPHKIVSFIAHLIGHEGQGSLSLSLKNQGLINALSAGHGISGQNFKDFNISLELTELGENQLDLILTQVFSYINFMRAERPPEYLYEEQQRLALTSFDFQEPSKPSKLANALSLNMQHYPIDDVLYGDYRMDGFELGHWNQIFNLLNANNMRVTLVSQNINTDTEAHWYHTPYSQQQIDADVLNELNAIEPNTGTFAYPSPNPYLQNEIHVEEVHSHSDKPICIESKKGWQLWFKQDITFKVPKGNIYVGLDLPKGVQTTQNQAILRLFCELFLDQVSDIHYQAETAGLNYNLYTHSGGITLYTSGLSNNQPHLLFSLVDQLFTQKPQRGRFEEIKRQLIKHWRNAESNKPISQLFSLLNAHLIPSMATTSELADELEHVSLSEFTKSMTAIMSDAFVESFIFGNWTSTQALAINETLKEKLDHLNLVEEVKREVHRISDTEVFELSKKVDHQDAAALIYLQGFSTKPEYQDNTEKACFILLSQILAPFAFNYLRTERQLGYMVGSGYMPISNVPGLAIYVQSHDFESSQLTTELHDCLELFSNKIKNLPGEDFLKHKEAIIHQYKERPANLTQHCQQLWASIGNKDYNFDQKQEIIRELEQLKLIDLTRWFSAYFNPQLASGIQINSR